MPRIRAAMRRCWPVIAALALALPAAGAAHAGMPEFDFHGSLGPGKHTRYVPPLVNPLFNETPYITTEARPAYLHYDLPDFLTTGGTIDVYALELRLALTERLGIIASKDGYARANFDAVLPDEDGFANISIGLKYAVHSDPARQSIVSLGIEYEPPSGDLETAGISLQGRGKGFVDIFATGAKAWDRVGIQGNVGANFAIDSDNDSSFIHYSGHVDYELYERFFPILELNGFSTIDSGNRTAGDFEGFDLLNFGATDSGTVITLAGGARYRLTDHVIAGIGYESPLTDREDIINWKFYADLVITF